MSNDWAKQLATQIGGERKKREIDREAFLEERKALAAHGQSLWEDLKGNLRKNAELLNLEIGEEYLIWETVRSNELRLRRMDTPHTLSGEYNQAMDRISFRSSLFAKQINYRVQLSQNGMAVLVSDEEGWKYAIEDIVREILTRFCGSK